MIPDNWLIYMLYAQPQNTHNYNVIIGKINIDLPITIILLHRQTNESSLTLPFSRRRGIREIYLDSRRQIWKGTWIEESAHAQWEIMMSLVVASRRVSNLKLANVTQSENKYHPRFHLKNLPKLAEHGWYLWRHEMEKASKSRLRPIGNAQILRCTCVS